MPNNPKNNKSIAKILLICFGPVIAITMLVGVFRHDSRPPAHHVHRTISDYVVPVPYERHTDNSRTAEDALDKFKCHSDDECLVTAKGGCTIKGVIPGKPNDDKKCRCLTGPVIFGCLPKDQAKIYENQSR
jgi:hypothetical protein